MKTIKQHEKELLKVHGAWKESETDNEIQYCFPSVYSKEQFEHELQCVIDAFKWQSLNPVHVEKLMERATTAVKPNKTTISKPEKWTGRHWCWLFGK